jgi:hypothetical protein
MGKRPTFRDVRGNAYDPALTYGGLPQMSVAEIKNDIGATIVGR